MLYTVSLLALSQQILGLLKHIVAPKFQVQGAKWDTRKADVGPELGILPAVMESAVFPLAALACTPLLSLIDKKEEVLDVAFPYFGGEDYKNPYYNASNHSNIQKRKVPVIKCQTKYGEIYCTTAFDLLVANYGVDRGLNDDNVAKDYSDNLPYTPAWQEQITGVPANQVITIARQFAENAAKTEGKSMIIIGAGVNQWYNTDKSIKSKPFHIKSL